MSTERLRLLRDFFPTAVFTGRALVFISEDFRVELTEKPKGSLAPGQTTPLVRVRIFQRTPDSEYQPGHYEDFELPDLHDLANEIEKFVQAAVGRNLKE